MKRHVLGASVALAAILGTFAPFTSARAAAIVHRLNLEIGGGATQLALGNLNRQIDFANRNLTSHGLNGFDHITYSFLFDAGVRYFVRPNVALRVGVGQLRTQEKREYLPAIGQDIQIRYEILSVPMHVGSDYYFAPYNQGDFQARGFVGGGLLNMVNNRFLAQQYAVLGDPQINAANSYEVSYQRDAPGWYADGGVHMFFALRYSVVLNAYYRSAKIRGLLDTRTKAPQYNFTDGKPSELDLSGIGARGALCIGF